MYINLEGVDIGKIPTLSQPEIRNLIQKVQEYDCPDSLDRLVKHNLRLVLNIVNRFKNNKESAEDLFQVGCVGLVNAARGFNLKYKVYFSTYAVPTIRGTIQKYLRDNKDTKITRKMHDLSYQLLLVGDEMREKLQREPTLSELADGLGVSQSELGQVALSLSHTRSWDEGVSDDDDTFTLSELVAGDLSTDETVISNLAIKDELDKLSEKERQVIIGLYINDYTQNRISELIGVSQPHVTRLKKSALKKLRYSIKQKGD